MINKVREYIYQYRMLQKGDRVIVGVSGGADSMALLSVLHRLMNDLGLELVVAHLHHGLRGREADADAELVRQTTETKGLPFFYKEANIRELSKQAGLSLEDTSRRERYAFFYQLLKDLSADKIALGHQFHDQAETVMLNFLRGAGSRGLRGIVPVRNQVLVRPLLGISRAEILAYLAKEKIAYREDASNRSGLFLRNRIRHDLLPYLKKYNPRVEERLHGMADTMRIENDFLEGQTEVLLKHWQVDVDSEEIAIVLNNILTLHEALQRRVIKSILESRSQDGNGISQTHVSAVIGLVRDGHVGQRLSLPFATEVFRQYDRLIFKKKDRRPSKEGLLPNHAAPHDLVLDNPCPGRFEYAIKSIPAEIMIKETGTRLRLTTTAPMFHELKAGDKAYLDYNRIEFPLIIRNIRPGDRFQPLGMTGIKKVKSFFIDRKIPQASRQRIPLLVDRKNILWIASMAINDTAKVNPATRICLKIEII